jgi:protein O-GlcNAc transferase
MQAKNPIAQEKFEQGLALYQKEDLLSAQNLCDEALSVQADHFDALHLLGSIALRLNRPDRASKLLEKATAIKPQHSEPYNDLGRALAGLKYFEKAIVQYDKAILLDPKFSQAYCNRGSALAALHRYDEAFVCYMKAVAVGPFDAEAYRSFGKLLYVLNLRKQALDAYRTSMSIDPDQKYILGRVLHLQAFCGEWANYNELKSRLSYSVRNHHSATKPFEFLSLSDSPSDQLVCSRSYVTGEFPNNPLRAGRVKRTHSKIRIAYVSGDFRTHPVSFLILGLIEAHDREHFEVIGISLRPEDGSEIGQRMKRAFFKFFDVSRMSDQAVVELMHELEIDIAIDLMGFTAGCRTGIFAMRAAPVQVNYLGYPGTMGATYIDYLIADHTLIPAADQKHFGEKIAYLPDCYMPNDSTRRISTPSFDRSDCGLPQAGFVFCCFNDLYKLNPSVFDCWMRILKQVEGSVLWLPEKDKSATAAANLKRETASRGVNPDRLVFAKPMPLRADHLARYHLADLFLDTLPYNAHVTTSDALWAGLPVLTLIGKTFAGRVAASMLNAHGLPELITLTPQGYEAFAIELATDTARLGHIKRKLADNRLTTPLFDTKLCTKHIEAAYTSMYERDQADLPPDHIYVS